MGFLSARHLRHTYVDSRSSRKCPTFLSAFFVSNTITSSLSAIDQLRITWNHVGGESNLLDDVLHLTAH